eukprot:965434-Rhodomonas_salina.2
MSGADIGHPYLFIWGKKGFSPGAVGYCAILFAPYARAMQSAVLSERISLRASYAMSGTELSYQVHGPTDQHGHCIH